MMGTIHRHTGCSGNRRDRGVISGKKMLRFFGFTLDPYEKDIYDEEL